MWDHDYESSTESNHINADIALILDHPDYDGDTTNFDLTLFKMKNTIVFSLHPHPMNDEQTYDIFIATVTGWVQSLLTVFKQAARSQCECTVQY